MVHSSKSTIPVGFACLGFFGLPGLSIDISWVRGFAYVDFLLIAILGECGRNIILCSYCCPVITFVPFLSASECQSVIGLVIVIVSEITIASTELASLSVSQSVSGR